MVTKLSLGGSRVFSQGLTARAELKLEPRASGAKSHVLLTCSSQQPLDGRECQWKGRGLQQVPVNTYTTEEGQDG